MKWTIRQRLAILFCIAAVIPALVVSVVAYWSNRELTRRFAINVEALASTAGQALDQEVLTARDQLQQIARQLPAPPLSQGQDADAMAAAGRSPERLATARHLRVMAALQQTFPVLLVTDRNKQIYADSSGAEARFGEMQADLRVNDILKNGFAISPATVYSSSTGRYRGFWVQVALPPPGDERLSTHFLSGFFQTEQLVDALRRQRIEGEPTDETGKFVLLDSSGKLLADSLPAKPTVNPSLDGAIQPAADGTVTVPASAFETAAEPAGAAAPESARKGRSTARSGEEVTGSATSDLTGYTVNAIVDAERVARTEESQGGLLASLLALSLVFGAILGVVLSRNFLAPMYRLLDGARAWQGGDMNYLFRGQNASGEWAELAESMNGLAARVHATRFSPDNAQPVPQLPDSSAAPDAPLAIEAANLKSLLRAATETESEGLLITDEKGRPLYSNNVFWETWEKPGLRQGLVPPAGAARKKLPLFKMLRQTTKAKAHLQRLRDLAAQPALKLSGQLDLHDHRRLQFSVRPYMQGDVMRGRIWRFRDISARSRLEEEVRTSKQLMENLVENLPLALFVKDVRNEFRVIIWNRAAEELYGITRMKAIGQPTDFMKPDEVAAALGEHDLAALQNGGPLEILEQRINTAARGERLLRVVKVPIYDSQRMATHLFCLAENITERTQTQKSLRQEHALLRGLIDSLPDLISFKSHSGSYLGCNKAFEEFTGLQEKDFLGKTDEQLFPGANLSLPPQIDRSLLTDPQPRWRGVELHLPDGRVAHLNTVETPLRGPVGEIWGILAVSQVAAITEAATKPKPEPAPASAG